MLVSEVAYFLGQPDITFFSSLSVKLQRTSNILTSSLFLLFFFMSSWIVLIMKELFLAQAIIDGPGQQLSTLQLEDLIGMVKNAEKSKAFKSFTPLLLHLVTVSCPSLLVLLLLVCSEDCLFVL